tara:strand:+ start:2149 stop:2829 length:681 start_codon:yes stop_codon:yes gene_type:complete
MNSPKHVAIIMDGNGRWGKKKNKSRKFGHKEGAKTVEKIIKSAIDNKINYLTLYSFSTENWKRPKKEVNFLLKLLENYIDNKLNEFIKNKIKIKIIGDLSKISKKLIKKLKNVEKLTSLNSKIQINVALNYGSRQEIIKSMKEVKKKSISFNQKNISKYLYTGNIPDPDILIRTGNKHRLSNFLLWQLMYTEIFFEKKLWPEFNKNDFNQIIKKYKKIERTYGGLI